MYDRWYESYEGWLSPKVGPAPYRILDDPALIKKKQEMRQALREEYNRRWLNPYRQAAGVGGFPFDPMIIRYNALFRTQHYYFRTGPRVITTTAIGMLVPIFLLIYFSEKERRYKSWRYRTGQVAYVDRPERNGLW